MRSENEKLLADLSEAICTTVDPGCVAVLVKMRSTVTILQFKADEYAEVVNTFAHYFDLVRCNGWRNCFDSAFNDPLPKKHIATILITSNSVENGVVFPLSEAN